MNSATVDLIYLDPPFNSNKKWQRPMDGKLQKVIETVIENDDELFQKWIDYVDKHKDSSGRVLIEFNDAWKYDQEKEEQHQTTIRDRYPAGHQIIEAIGESHSLKMKAYMIFMAVRLIEMKRVLRETGAIYLHCDDTAGHYLKLLMDAIFGVEWYVSHINWQRSASKSDAKKQYGRIADHILYYASPSATFNPQYTKHRDEYIRNAYKHDDGDGRGFYRLDNMCGPGGYHYSYKGFSPNVRGWKCPIETMEQYDKDGLIHFPKNDDGSYNFNRRLSFKRFLSTSKGVVVKNMWTDINALNAKQIEATGYPTQKPLALLERIIKTSSNEGDIVFDPFCGCATAIEAAYKLGRNWIGCDHSFMTVPLVRYRLQGNAKAICGYKANPQIAPTRDDVKEEAIQPDFHSKLTPSQREEIRMYYFGQQKGVCEGCGNHYDYKIFHLDHKRAKSKGGRDEKDNLQLLCGPCNSRKGAKDESECPWMYKFSVEFKRKR